MANEITRGGIGNMWVRYESPFGTGTGTYKGLYLEEAPALPTDTKKLIANSPRGYRNPLSVGRPIGVDVAQDTAFRLKQRIRRTATDGAASALTYFFEGAGWKEDAGNASTVEAGATATSFTMVSNTGVTAGECVIVELSISGTTVYFPCLVAAVSGDTITPSIALPVAPAEGAVVEVMNSYSPTSTTGQQLPATKGIQFRYNSNRYYDDSVGDGAVYMDGCAVSDLGAIEIGGVGTVPMLDWGIHASNIYMAADDIGADSFVDYPAFSVITDRCEFAFAATNSGSGIGTLVSKNITKATFNPGLKQIPVKAFGSSGTIGGNQAFVMQNEPATVMLEGNATGDSALDEEMYTQLTGSNASKYIHFIQPTTDLDHPAFGIWMPNCHMAPDGEFKIDDSGDIGKWTVTYQANIAAWGSEESPEETDSAPIVFGISNEAA